MSSSLHGTAGAHGSPRILEGRVEDGYGHAVKWLPKALPLIEGRIGVSGLIPATLNVRLTGPYLMRLDASLTRAEYNEIEEAGLQRCRVLGLQCVLYRPYLEQPVASYHRGLDVVEIIASRHFRNEFGFENDTAVEIEVEGDEQWWTGLSASPG